MTLENTNMINYVFVILVTVVVVPVTAEAGSGATVFKKCCLEDESLIKLLNDTDPNSFEYQCLNTNDILSTYDIASSPLIVGGKVTVQYGMPEDCETTMLHLVDIEETQTSTPDKCYDRLVLEVVGDNVMPTVPKTIMMMCNSTETEEANFKIDQFRKCCPIDQSYDTAYHICRDDIEAADANWLAERLNVTDNYVFEVETGLNCKAKEWSVELSEVLFKLHFDEGALRVTGNSQVEVSASPRQWCVDRQFDSTDLVARVCTENCADYGAFCMKKCCPIGQHYQPLRCGSDRSVCVNSNESTSYNLSQYLEPLKEKNRNIDAVIGFQGLNCDHGRYFMNEGEEDKHWLTEDGTMQVVWLPEPDWEYCIETVDKRLCDEPVQTLTVHCLKPLAVVKDFSIGVVVNIISSVCLALTLMVYIAVPELRNLHGRTVICHVSMMLLGYSCMARVQYDYVSDTHWCTILGYGIYFGFMGAFFWLNVMCFDIWWTFGSIRTIQPLRKASVERRRFAWYSLYAWGLTVTLTIIMFLLDRYPVSQYLDANIGGGVCWFGSVQNTDLDWPHYIYFVIPMGLIVSTNFVLWVLTARHCARVKSEVHRLQAGSVGDRAKKRFRLDRAKYVLTGKLWVVMGAAWVSELLSTLASEPKWLWVVIDLMNELQGVFIFLILVMKPKLYYLIRKRLGLEKPEPQKNGTSSSGRTSSTFLSRTISSDERTNPRTSVTANLKI